MSAIWKFILTEPETTVSMPKGAEIVHVAAQRGEPAMWVLVEPKFDMEPRHFLVVGTGHDFERLGTTYLGTCHLENLGLVFHVFEREAPRG